MRTIYFVDIQRVEDHNQPQPHLLHLGPHMIRTNFTSSILLTMFQTVCTNYICFVFYFSIFHTAHCSLIGACRVTKVPRNGWIEYTFEPKEKLSPGEFVNSLTTVNYKCLANHVIEGATANFCFQGAWRNPIPDCQPRCSTKAINGTSKFV